MSKYVKEFFHRGLIFSGLGPIVVGIVWFILSKIIADFEVSAAQVLMGIASTYLLAFLQAGATVFNQIESWGVAKSLFWHFLTLYAAYAVCYISNNWIPFEPAVLMIFSAVFVLIYFVIWITVYFSVKAVSEKMSAKLN